LIKSIETFDRWVGVAQLFKIEDTNRAPPTLLNPERRHKIPCVKIHQPVSNEFVALITNKQDMGPAPRIEPALGKKMGDVKGVTSLEEEPLAG
jgi:hypothetical protein